MNDRKHGHYFKIWNGAIDIYRLCELFSVKRKPIDHAIKKLLCAGNRGAKDEIKDYQEAIDSINRAIEMIKEDDAAQNARMDIVARNGNDGLHYQEIKPYQDDFEQ